ncbi:APC family permease [Tuwongella immobilis]|uniref:Amino acid transporter n=1 Tax=Tuwongella immobilis TaxID=692036 RepID=A0A6C2YIV3_9BACT|nr:amino acid transporter [Tuwongella immobilis]VIP01015.1 Putative amino acid transporter OS=Nostoc punctiforme (strain ATCC 29133 / PCC 73102) GN=Npun_F2400 PE=4 SV=1 [Tuwongella immobilis]VTR97454.1 Putative amino acid transporter OS=Nostoc punctiforme (strain ATCC 29133 / PCC 73102) GN=Npun_F2400 PE=4 SV=1 [Tuwongella immobilis]
MSESQTAPAGSEASGKHGGHHQSFWLWVMCLTGVDYFSTLGYQPSIAFENAGLLAPFATIVLVAVTLFGALPIYSYVASQSFSGQGSIGMFARLMSGWTGKIVVLTLLGFAATDFVITKTLSAADAAEHLLHNPMWPWDFDKSSITSQLTQRLTLTMGLLVFLGGMFLRGFREVIGLAVVIVAVYLTLNAIVIGAGLLYLFEHPDKFTQWMDHIRQGASGWYLHENPLGSGASGFLAILALSFLLFPKLALGLSGFETGVAVMPLIKGSDDDPANNPQTRIRNTRKLLTLAALIMSVYLMGSSMVVSTLIPPEELTEHAAVSAAPGGPGASPEVAEPVKPKAKDRALAYLAHGEAPDKISSLFGPTFGTMYDLATVVILWFAGASAMAGLLNLVPQYLPRYGMAPEWANATRPLVLLLTGINLLVTWIFKADVSSQGGAYATGVLVLMTSAGFATVLQYGRTEGRNRWRWYGYIFITIVFLYTTADIVITKPEGIRIAAFFIFTILATSLISRIARSRELRFAGFEITDPESSLLWGTIKMQEKTCLVPHRPGRRSLKQKAESIRREHRIRRYDDIILVEVQLQDASEFVQKPQLEITQEDGQFLMKISGAASIAHTLAAVALEISKEGKPPEIHFGWTEETPWSGTLGFLLFGEGNVPWMVRDLIRRAQPDPSKRPLIIIGGS